MSKNGYIYPSSMQAQTVCEFLREYAMELGVKIKTNNNINSIQQNNGKYVVDIGIPLECDNLILATGGKSYEVTGSDGSGYELAMKFGHTITFSSSYSSCNKKRYSHKKLRRKGKRYSFKGKL